MKPIGKILAAIAGGILLLAIVAAISFSTLVDPNDYKEEIITAVHDATGRQVTFTGDMSLTLFPWFGIKLGEVSLNNPEGFKKPIFASVQQAEVSVKVLPLLYRQVEFSDVVLQGLTLNLIETKDGRNNWTFTPSQKVTKPKRRGSVVYSTPEKRTSEASALAALFVESLSVSDTTITYHNQRDGRMYEASDISITSSALRAGKNFSLALRGIFSSYSPAIEAPFQLTIDATPSEDFASVDVTSIHAVLEPKGKELPGGAASISLSSSLRLDLFNKVLVVENAELSAYETTLAVDGEVKYADATTVNGHASLTADYRKISKALGISPPQPANDNSSLSLSTGIKIDPENIAFNDIQGDLNGYPLNGDFSYYFGSQPQLKLRLLAEQIELDPYIALAKLINTSNNESVKKTTKAKAKTKKTRSIPAPVVTGKQSTPLAQQTLSKLMTHAEIKIKKLIVDSIPVNDISIVGKGTNGVVTIDPFRFHIFDGKVTGTVKTDLRGTLPITSGTLTTDGIQLESLSRTFTGNGYISGKLLLNASLSAYGTSWDSVSRTLNGKAHFSATDGIITGLNLLPADALELIPEKNRSKVESSLTAQPFKVIRASLFAKNGRVSNNDLLIDAAEMTARGSGFANLPTDSIHYRADIKFDNIPEIPVQISGKLASPSYAVDMQRFLGKSAQELTDTLLNQDKDGESNPLKLLKKGLKNLFN